MPPQWNQKTCDLTGQVAVVTGAGRGIGREFARALAAAGASVAITARTASEVEDTARLIQEAGGRAIPFTADVSDGEATKQVAAAVEQQLGPVDLLVNNAAIVTPVGWDWDIDPDEWWQLFSINLRGPYMWFRAVLPGMMARRSGRIINISSGAAHRAYPYGTAYCASKAALTNLTQNLSDALADSGVKVFAYAPSGRTSMTEYLATTPGMPEYAGEHFRRAIADDPEGKMERNIRGLMFIASGAADALAGRHISSGDVPDVLLERCNEIIADDLYTLRLRI